MSVASQQHNDIAKELQASFSNHPFIKIEARNSSPSEEYRVTYSLRGLVTDENEEIKESQQHVIQITIPFGYPLFPPNCKPLTPVFHPDFDPGAICLGDFWDQDRTCTELIMFLGKMITGELYSKENAFNEKAAIWYIAHADQFPLTDSGGSSVLSRTAEVLDFELDTVKEEDFSTDFDYLSLESDNILAEPPTKPFNESKEYDLDLLQERLAKKRFQQLDRELSAIPISIDFAERDFLRRETDDALIASKKLQQQAQRYEAAGDLQKALATYEKAQSTVSDLYGVESTIQRIRQAITLGPLKNLQAKKSDEVVLIEEDKDEEEKVLPQKKQLPKINLSLKYLLIIPILVFAILGFELLTSSKQAKNVRLSFDQCRDALNQKKFQQAQSDCSQAYEKSQNVRFIYKNEMQQLSADAKKILESKELTQGLIGKILVDGVWVYQDEAIRISPFETLISKSQETLTNKEWDETTTILRQASPLAQTDLEKQTVQDLINEADFFKTQEEAFAIFKKDGCKRGEPLLLEAQEKANLLPLQIRKQYLSEISYKLTECAFYHLIGEGNKLYEAADWNAALPLYRNALKEIKKSPHSESVAIEDIKNKINRAELYDAINQGNSNFSDGAWDKAIAQYKRAIDYINEDPELSTAGDSQLNSTKLSRIILQAKIIQSQQLAQKSKTQNDFNGAIEEYKKIAIFINESAFSKEDDFVATQQTVDTEIVSLKKQRVIEDHRQYLLNGFMDLFLKNYPAATRETLVSPIVTFILEEKNQLIYKMQATEIGRGRPLSLVMFYAYNTQTKQWSFTSAPETSKIN